MDERIDSAVGLAPDLIAERVIADDRVVIVQLIRPPMLWSLADATCGFDHLLDQRRGNSAAIALDVGDASAVRLHRSALLIAERVGEHDLDAVALRRGDEGETDARRACRVL